GRKRVGRETLVHEGEGALEIRIAEVGIVTTELIGQKHPFVDKGAARDRNRIIAGIAPFTHLVEPARDGLAQNIKPPLERFGIEIAIALGDENLLMKRFGWFHRHSEA